MPYNIQTDQTILEDLVREGKDLLRSLDDGYISPSAYDTAWVARIPAKDDPNQPMFPQALAWVRENQLPDGSWGIASNPYRPKYNNAIEHFHDRIICTVSCLIALAIWEPDSIQIVRGERYIYEHIDQLRADTHATVGFELLLPELLETARALNVDLPYESPVIEKINQYRNLKLSKIPIQVVYARPTTLLHSLEGFGSRLDCHKVLKFQAGNGSFLNSPSATAFVYMHTSDEKALAYIEDMLEKFDGAVPVNYPIDIFERLWVLNNVYSLNLEHYFREEIEHHINYIEEQWSSRGMVWSRYVQTPDIDDTAVAFKLLRLNGRNVSPDVFKNFYDEKSGNFFCFPGELDASLSHMISLRDTSEVFFKDDDGSLLQEARNFSLEFLNDRLNNNKLDDKWYFRENTRDIVSHAIKKRRFFKIPFTEKRKNIELYRSTSRHDYWIDKTIYLVPNINSEIFLEIAELENKILRDSFHQELKYLQAWAETHMYYVDEAQVRTTLGIACHSAPRPDQRNTRLIMSKITLRLFDVDVAFTSVDNITSKLELVSAIFKDGKDALLEKYPAANQRGAIRQLWAVVNNLIEEVTSFRTTDLRSQLLKNIEYTVRDYLKRIHTLDAAFDVDYARLSIGAALALELTIFRTGGASSEMLNSPDYYDLLDTSRDILNFLADIRLTEKKMADGKAETVGLGVKGKTKEETVSHFFNYYESVMEEFYQFALKSNDVPTHYKMLAFDLCQTMASLYEEDNFKQQTSTLFDFVKQDAEEMVPLDEIPSTIGRPMFSQTTPLPEAIA